MIGKEGPTQRGWDWFFGVSVHVFREDLVVMGSNDCKSLIRLRFIDLSSVLLHICLAIQKEFIYSLCSPERCATQTRLEGSPLTKLYHDLAVVAIFKLRNEKREKKLTNLVSRVMVELVGPQSRESENG
jgi:hypothetical protein